MSRPIRPGDLARCVTVNVDGHLALVRVGVDVGKLTEAEREQLTAAVRELVQELQRRATHGQ